MTDAQEFLCAEDGATTCVESSLGFYMDNVTDTVVDRLDEVVDFIDGLQDLLDPIDDVINYLDDVSSALNSTEEHLLHMNASITTINVSAGAVERRHAL